MNPTKNFVFPELDGSTIYSTENLFYRLYISSDKKGLRCMSCMTKNNEWEMKMTSCGCHSHSRCIRHVLAKQSNKNMRFRCPGCYSILKTLCTACQYGVIIKPDEEMCHSCLTL